VLRLGGLIEALPGRVERLQNFLWAETEMAKVEAIQGPPEATFWAGANSCRWVGEGLNLVKIPLSPKRIPALEKILPATASRRYSAGGNVAWLCVPDVDTLDTNLKALDLVGLVLFGSPNRPFVGKRKGVPLAQRVKRALDPDHKFLEI
jgi:hypothetical protein